MTPESLLALLPNTALAFLVYAFGKREIVRLEKEKADAEALAKKQEERLHALESRILVLEKALEGKVSTTALENAGNRITAAQQAATAEQNVRITALDRDVMLMKYVFDERRGK